ncbi:hypothetical protein H6F86_05995 [Phormidium sp. FACHB-592]|uniref:HEAT repeat domain-containing protein n=1 Tax=Stenomitos frigidus AS-A4 TaxID=2933935 RepID=A0ABV0KQZ8_9CYAN|nr:hypothetical protein [Phormidium sp. FACHB-592]MBD2073444.1 hypothetical protein [Phormidium sp. FACHB-592]
MLWTERVIAAHKRRLSERAPDRRKELITCWELSRSGDSPEPAIKKAFELVADGNANERELGFYVLMDLALNDPSLSTHISQLAHHRFAAVRRGLAFYLSRSFPLEFQVAVYRTLLQDKAASVRVSTITSIGMVYLKDLLPELRTLRATERNVKVIESLDYWVPLLETGYRVELSQTPGTLLVTALTGNGIASKNVKTTDPNDPLILHAVEELRNRP